MSRPSSSFVPKYRKHRASGQAIVTISGRDYYLGPHGSKASRIEYDRLITEWLVSGRSGTFGSAAGELSIAELLVAYLKYAKKYYGTEPNSEYFHFRRIARPIKELYSSTPVVEFGPLQFKAIRQRLIDGGGARSYINPQMQRARRIFKWGAAEGMIPPSVPQSLAMVVGLRKGKTDARETDPILPVEDAIVDASLEYMPGIPADMVRFQRLTGCRPDEVCTLKPCDLDRSEEIWMYRPAKHKTEHHGRDRTIFIGPKAQGVLLRYLARDAQTHCFRPCDSEEKRRAAASASRKTPLSCDHGSCNRHVSRRDFTIRIFSRSHYPATGP
jgi:integrase